MSRELLKAEPTRIPDEGLEPMSTPVSWPWTTARLAVRPGRAGDAEVTWPWRADDELNRWLTSVPTSPEEHMERWTAGLGHSYVAEVDGRIVATGKIEPEPAWGQAEVASQARGTQVEVGWIVSPAHQGQGIGTEFARALLDIAFAGGARRVTAYCFADNGASAHMMEKIGMRREAHFRKDSLHRSGEWLDSLAFAILDSDPR